VNDDKMNREQRRRELMKITQ